MPVRKRGLSLALAAPASAAPDRDLVLMLTADEESTGASGIMLSTTHRDLIAADFALNTDAGGVIEGPDGVTVELFGAVTPSPASPLRDDVPGPTGTTWPRLSPRWFEFAAIARLFYIC